ncbi:thioredoxin family protein [Kordia zhangzhouensis]|uniref:thioredoxin family protein n=1 Tax=Kordia zhangzhouensis TaxID=1620405 RepID=UPI000629557F|nr:thioredoxin family protein [Kordia zhangzhouensis]
MKKTLYILILVSFMACKNEKKESTPENTATSTEETNTEVSSEEEEEELPILTGIQSRTAISEAPYNVWFEPTYAVYPVDKELATQIKPLFEDVHVKVFMGTWCEDSQREVPQFYKILDMMDISEKKVELITVDEDKTTPQNLEEGLDITNVPTLIFYRNGKELNRIVESPVISLEQDMLDILSGKDYKHTYAE